MIKGSGLQNFGNDPSMDLFQLTVLLHWTLIISVNQLNVVHKESHVLDLWTFKKQKTSSSKIKSKAIRNHQICN